MPTHVPPERLDDYLCGRLDGPECDLIERHLDGCESCAALTAQRHPQDALLELLQHSHEVGVSEFADMEAQTSPSAMGDSPIATPEVRIFLDKQNERLEPGSQWESLATESFKNAGLDEFWDGEVELKNHPRYEILQPLGRGGMGVVWLARHKTMERLVALKIVRRSWRSHDRLISWFRNEARVISRLKHPNIVSAYDAEDSGDHHFIVFEYIDGQTLSQIARENPLEEREALETIRTVAVALAYAHAQGLVHRDIKPGNLIRDDQGVIKILDFGIAFEIEDLLDSDQPHAPVGTRAYLAPECFRSAPPSSVTDIYALGCTLYYLLVGKHAEAAIDALVTRDVHRGSTTSAESTEAPSAQDEPLSHLSNDPRLSHVSVPTQQLIAQMTARNAAQRPATADNVIALIDHILKGVPSVDTDPTAQQLKSRVSRRIALGAIGSAALLSAGTLVNNKWPLFSESAQQAPPHIRLSRKFFESTCPGFATNLDRFGAGTDELLLSPSTLGDGEDQDFNCTDRELNIHVYEQNRQAWLNYEFVRGRHLCLFIRAQVQRYQSRFSNFKAAFLDHQGRECNFQWIHDGQSKRLLMEVVTRGRLMPVWRKDLDDDSAFSGDLAMHLDGANLEVYLNDELLTAQTCEESSTRFPAIASNGCDVSVCALARLIA